MSTETPCNTVRYWSFVDGNLHAARPKGLFVQVEPRTTGFVFVGAHIEGEGWVGEIHGTPGWLELLTGQFYAAMTARAPARPFVEGTWTEEGFVPLTRTIQY